jgi:Family of unknown function (DUF6459)
VRFAHRGLGDIWSFWRDATPPGGPAQWIAEICSDKEGEYPDIYLAFLTIDVVFYEQPRYEVPPRTWWIVLHHEPIRGNHESVEPHLPGCDMSLAAPLHQDSAARHPKVAIRRGLGGLDDAFDRQRADVAELGDPVPVLQELAHGAVLALLGEIRPDALRHRMMPDIYSQLLIRHLRLARERLRCGQRPGRVALGPGVVVLSSSTVGTYDAVVVLRTRSRARVVAIRLEGLDHRWMATELGVL